MKKDCNLASNLLTNSNLFYVGKLGKPHSLKGFQYINIDIFFRNHNLDDMCAFIGADSLGFLSLDGLYKAMGFSKGRDNENPQFTDHCFTGDYPTDLKDYNDKNLQEQLSLISDNETSI